MRHTLQTEGFGIRIRPVRMDDAAFIVWLRNLDHARGKVGDSATDTSSQEAWLKTYFEREGDYYFILETLGGIPVGTHGIYDLRGGSAEMGRFIVRPDVMAAVPTSVLSYALAFEKMGLTELRATAVASNRKLHSFVRKSGFRQVGLQPAAQIIGGVAVDILHFILTLADWPQTQERLTPLARLAETQVREWEAAQPHGGESPGVGGRIPS
jgi:RimJ/RimL family protein N-acetyltransferase